MTIPSVKLNIFSDLHFSKGDLPLPGESADLVILAAGEVQQLQAHRRMRLRVFA